MPAALPFVLGGAAIIGAGAVAIGTVKTIESQNKMAKAQKEQFKYERQMNQNKSIRERKDAIRAARMIGGTLTQNAENAGGSGSSAALGSQGSIVSQLNTNLSFLDTQTSLADKAGAQSQVARAAQVNGQKWGAVSDLGMAVFNTAMSQMK